MADFVNVNDLCECVTNVLKEKGEDFAKSYPNIDGERIADLCDEEGYRIGLNWAESLRDYCNQSDHRIFGNFNNVEWDYEREHEGKRFETVCNKLNNSVDDDDTKEFKDWVIGWLFETFGTFGLKYNFADTLYAVFQEEVDEYESNEAL